MVNVWRYDADVSLFGLGNNFFHIGTEDCGDTFLYTIPQSYTMWIS